MKLHPLISIVSILASSCSNSCEKPIGLPVVYPLRVQNNSSSLIFYQISKIYPDTSIQDSLVKGGILPSKQQSYESRKTWPKFFESLPADTLSIFFFSPDTIYKYGWKQVQSKYLVLRRKDISLKDLETNNYIVTYP
ncbi:hypothetical protein J2Y45_004694 [Dyadobacter sp. BE34]|uniref:Lipoprotein n=1 Tax=Dyadobacter fermentans TaxID=94254 RepID=A0ABU1R269_9BACT|nr:MULTISPECIES: hypothetical protein [Dyadobacter]MDR6807494.1 hypothetical protein [Dyadobacter fermentans]MDR7045235.1 hypothetical protein [Dyadobacter sp. BE242]MDR7199548.1 hypothetical protein [Dyadobacter sp. BE34]MDR7217993.1 hypothetical protein [Dyadobacter sp. BE31]MDR7265439.1 hypothetical protein [Dyadobacter sp. BE32]